MLDSPVTERMTAQETGPLSNPIAVMEASQRVRQFCDDHGRIQAPVDDIRLLVDAAERGLADLERCGVASITHLDPDDQTLFDSSTAADAAERLRARLDAVRARLSRCVSELGGEPAGDLGRVAKTLERLVSEAVADRGVAASGMLSVEVVDLESIRRQVVERLVAYIHYTRARVDRQMRRGGGEIDVERFFADLVSGLLPAARGVGAFSPSADDLATLKAVAWLPKLALVSNGEPVDQALAERFGAVWTRLLECYGEERA